MISKFFIEHPVLANVLAIVLVVIGAVSLYRLPVSEYPNVVPPTVQVTASYAGASAQTVVNTVALPIENQVNGAGAGIACGHLDGRRNDIGIFRDRQAVKQTAPMTTSTIASTLARTGCSMKNFEIIGLATLLAIWTAPT